MRRLIFIAAMSAMVLAKPKPETYRETEDFQYSRSSSDDGSKSGYYGAQRGNMGGNYERAHNMDNLALHQMSGLVRQVDGELGDGAKTRTGSVYTAANSRGIFGSGNYDLSNLKGRNFAEGESLGTSQSHSSLSSQHNSGYDGYSYGATNSAGFSSSSHSQNSRYSGYQSSGHADQSQIDNLQATDMSQGHSRYENDNQAGYNMHQRTQYGSHGRNEFDQSSSNLYGSSGFNGNSQTRYITTPVRVVLRPGGRVAIPIAAPTYDVSQSSLSDNKNIINTDAEVLTQQTNFKPANKVKHYESSYSYRKEWEKHNTQPADISVVVPTENPFPKNSELYEDAQLLQSSKNQFANTNIQATHSSNVNSEHRARTSSAAASQSRLQSGFNTQQSHSSRSQHRQSGYNAQESSAASDTYANTYGQVAQQSGMAADLTNAAENIDLKPKSYQSSYSYHKSWERQGDPYVIKPVGVIPNGQASQRLTAGTSNGAAYSSHQYGSRTSTRQAHQTYLADCDCDEEGHVRVARSYTPEQEQQLLSQWQQEQSNHANLEDLGQQTQSKWENLEDLGQQTQSKWENLEELGQQQQQNKWDNLQDLGQQTQNQWGDNLQQLGQETQNQWDNLQQLGQQTQNQWDNLQQLGQQTEHKWDKLEDLGQQTQRDLEQSQHGSSDFSQHDQKEDVLTNFEQQANGEDTDIGQKTDTQQENHPISTNWDQTPVFNIQTNKENTDNLNTHHTAGFDQHQQNPWFQIPGANTNFDTFMKPVSGLNDHHGPNFQKPNTDAAFNVNEKPNFFPLPASNTGYNSWTQNNDKDNFWKLNHNQNTHYNHGNHHWHSSEYHNNQFGHNSHSHSFSTSNADTSIQGLWDNIDNIAKEFVVTNDKQDSNPISHSYSNFDTNYQHGNHMQHGFQWGYIPKPSYPQFVIPHINTDKVKEDKDLEKHLLFEEEIHSTTIKPNKVQIFNPKPVEIDDTALNTQDKRPFHRDENVHSKDEGRGDIGPEDTFNEFMTENKPEKTPEEIESLSITKERNHTKPDTTIIQLNPMKNTQDDSTFKPLTLVASPNTPISTTEKNDNLHNVLQNKSLTNPQNPRPSGNAVESYDIPQNIPQLNLEKHFLESLGQQTQTSWSGSNLQQGYDQQNVEQQFENFHQPEIYKNNPLAEIPNHNPQEQTTECVETPEDLQQQHSDHQFLENWDQKQGSWFSDNLQHGYDQQNTEQQFEVFNQPEIGKPYNNPQEIESLSLTNGKPRTITKVDTIRKPNVEESSNINEQHKLFSTFESHTPSSTPSTQISSTIKSNNDHSVNNKPYYDMPTLNKNSSPEIPNNKPQEQTTECDETPENNQQQHVEQQFVDNWDQQLQGPWFVENLQHGYGQQNMEQQLEVFNQPEIGKQYKNPKEIESLSLTNEKPDRAVDTITKQNVQENTNINEQHKSFSTFHSHIPSSTPAAQISTTIKYNNDHGINPKPSYVQPNIYEKPNHKPQEQTTECEETPEDIQQQNLEQQFVDNWDQQLQGPWFGDNLQQGYDQQNVEQQFEVFQQHENNHGLQTFPHNLGPDQSPLQSFDNIQQIENKDTQSLLSNYEEKHIPPVFSTNINGEPKHPTYTSHAQSNPNDNSLQDSQKAEDVKSSPEKISEPDPSPVEVTSKKPGFWNSLSNKFTNAKNKVSSWFNGS